MRKPAKILGNGFFSADETAELQAWVDKLDSLKDFIIRAGNCGADTSQCEALRQQLREAFAAYVANFGTPPEGGGGEQLATGD